MAGTARALLLGVPETTLDGFDSLPGVHLDLVRIRSMLVSRDFTVSDVNPPAATVGVVAAAIRKLVAETRAGDLGVVYLGGHGTQRPDADGDEQGDEALDEAFVCTNGVITDDWFRAQLWPTVHEDSSFVVVADTCHSETIVVRIQEELLLADPPRFLHQPRYSRVVLSGCRDAGKVMEDDRGSTVISAMLTALEAKPTSYRALWQTVEQAIALRYPELPDSRPTMTWHGPDSRLVDSRPFQWPM